MTSYAAPTGNRVGSFTDATNKIGSEANANLMKTDNAVSALDFSAKKIYTNQAVIIASLIEDQIQPPGLFDLDDPDANVVTMAMMMIEQIGLVLALLYIDSRREQRNKIKEEFNLQLKGIEQKLAKDLEVARTQYKMGATNVRAAKVMMKMAVIQFYTSIAAATAKAIGAALEKTMPGVGATASIAGGVLEATSGFTGHGISAVQILNQAQQSYLQAEVTKLTAEGSAIERYYQAAANMVGGERSLIENMGRSLQDMFQNNISTLNQMANQQYLHLIV